MTHPWKKSPFDAFLAKQKHHLEYNQNEVVKQTNAYKNNKIIYLEHSNVWYTASGGITALSVMFDDLELGLSLNK